MWVHWCLWGSLFAVVSAEVITLVNDTTITCALTGDSRGEHIQINNSTHFIQVKASYIDVMQCDDSKRKDQQCTGQIQKRNSSNIVYEHTENETRFSICVESLVRVNISDKFINLTNESGNYSSDYCYWKYLKIQEKSIVLATTTDKGNEEITPNNDKKYPSTENLGEEKKSEKNPSQEWTVIIQNSNTNIEKYNFTHRPKLVIFEIDVNPLGKTLFHIYNLSHIENVNEASLSESYINIDPPYECLTMLVSADVGCYINVTLNSDHEELVKKTISFTKDEFDSEWKQIKVKTNRDQAKKLYFHPGSNNASRRCKWEIHNIQKCQHEYDIYHKTTPKSITNEYVCKTRKSGNDTYYPLINCNSTHIGKNCSIKCSYILGNSFPNCENHRICVEDTCYCAWRSKGARCDQTFQNGYWGFDCDKRYGKNCGECEPNYDGCKKFTLPKCSVVVHPPELVAIVNDMVELQINLKHNENEFKPQYFILQYKKIPSDDYQNYSKEEYFPTNLTKKILLNNSKIDPRNTSYELRVLLIPQNRCAQDDVPTLTIPQQCFAPENLKIQFSANSSNIILSWQHPDNVYVQLKDILVTINYNHRDEPILVNVKKDQGDYTAEIPIKSCKNYTLTVFGKNQCKSENATIFVFISKPVAKISQLPFIVWCTDICHLLKPNNVNNVYVQDRRGNKPKSKQRGRKGLPEKHSTNYSDINFNNVNHTLLHNIELEATHNGQGYNIDFANNETTTETSMSSMLTIIPICGIIIVILLLAVYYVCKRKQNANKSNFTTLELSHLIKDDALTKPIDYQVKNISIDELENYIVTTMEQDPYDNEIITQFHGVPKTIKKYCQIGERPENKTKNRYKDILPYDDTRVILQDHEEDYINANYVDGYNKARAFIATQAPLESTVNDFWTMIFENEVQKIIMLTELRENGRTKCTQYWPEDQTRSRFGKFLIETISSKITPNYVNRKLQVSNGDHTLEVQHYQYMTWPDHGIPNCVTGFTNFIKEIMSIPQESPIVVHCNAGCGRTGTYIMCDMALRMAIQTREVSFLKILQDLREQRCSLVSAVDQYLFAHQVVWEYFFGQNFSIPVDNKFESAVRRVLEGNYIDRLAAYLEKTTMQIEKYQLKLHTHLTDEEKAKNRFSTILPGNHQIFLPVESANESNYINAVSVDCHRCPRKFVVTQQPLPHTINDFWKLIQEYDIDTIVSLNKIVENDANCPRFWPHHNEEWPTNTETTLSLFDTNTDNEEYDIFRVKIQSGDLEPIKKLVTIIHVKNWKRETWRPIDFKDLISIWKLIMTSSSQIVVTCYDGTTASGFFVALACLLEKINMDHICDVYSAVKSVRGSRSQFVNSPEQLRFLYEAALEYVQGFSTYGNFS